MASFLCSAIRGYQRWLSPVLPGACRYSPTCSQYAIDAIELRGASRGVVLALGRLIRCRPGPGGGSGYDPIG